MKTARVTMRWMKYKILLILGILIGTAGQLIMKQGVNALGGVHISPATLPTELLRMFTNPYVLIGLVFAGLSFVLWIAVISNLELSFAYPFVATSYIIILLFGYLIYHENVNLLRIGGVALIGAGVILIAGTGGKD